MTARSQGAARHRSHKPKLLLDEGLPPRTSYPNLNRYCDIKHIKHDFKLDGIEDEQVYKLACSEGRILVTFNIKDFKRYSRSGVSVIGLSPRLLNAKIDLKLTSLIKRLKASQCDGHYFSITK